ncbi:hypothetical protein F2Q69_00044444 [Brassica cretica]|uniref:Uncharacterized protein n=1 Tax=Brassica cretica TaxID=69181 RepID=A0A8S9NFY6_BRACR|nr:hypothetical protein F2Q69_00044444 [Brassica cretica]
MISKRIFPSVWLLISSVALMFGPQEIMSTLFFGAGGGELGDSCSVFLPLFGFLIFVLTAKRGLTFFGRMAFAVMEGTIFDEVVCRIPLRSSLWGSILTGPRRSCLRACSVELSNHAWWKVLVADGVRFSGIEWFNGGILVLGSPSLSVDLFWNWIGVLRGRWSPVSISSNPL